MIHNYNYRQIDSYNNYKVIDNNYKVIHTVIVTDKLIHIMITADKVVQSVVLSDSVSISNRKLHIF